IIRGKVPTDQYFSVRLYGNAVNFSIGTASDSKGGVQFTIFFQTHNVISELIIKTRKITGYKQAFFCMDSCCQDTSVESGMLVKCMIKCSIRVQTGYFVNN